MQEMLKAGMLTEEDSALADAGREQALRTRSAPAPEVQEVAMFVDTTCAAHHKRLPRAACMHMRGLDSRTGGRALDIDASNSEPAR